MSKRRQRCPPWRHCDSTLLYAEVDSHVARQARSSDINHHSGSIKLQAQLKHRLHFRAEPYTLTLHLPPPADNKAGNGAPHDNATPFKQGYGQRSAALMPLGSGLALRDAPHRLQHWFGARGFALLAPDSYSGRVLDEEVWATIQPSHLPV
jgi:hypothetical protein